MDDPNSNFAFYNHATPLGPNSNIYRAKFKPTTQAPFQNQGATKAGNNISHKQGSDFIDSANVTPYVTHRVSSRLWGPI
ncbi:hypothetical protein PIB30_097842, partial [Stylosanthes scabra]|nr:hypothetical protein [Stylosanthes scabra]